MKEIKIEKDVNELKNENIIQENNNNDNNNDNNENHQPQSNNSDNTISVSNEHVHDTNGATISNNERRVSLDENHSTKQESKQRCSSFTQPFINCYKLLKKIGYCISQPFIKIWMKLPEIIRFSIKNLFSIPTMAAILGVIFMLIKPIRDPLLVSGNWSIIGRCISYLGSCTVFCALFLLGGALSNGPRGGTISTWKIMIGIIARMVIIPTICWVATYLLYKYEILPSNKVMYFVLQIESFAPPALNSLVVVNVCYPNGTNSTSTILFWSYMLAIISLTVDIIITMTTLDN
ncbi:transporter, auxin efflux carrier family protein [Entamoeba histolytica HM-1:IMSS-B]|uniref:Transporter, auxin efflux carrier family protein n=4 Tax=Entamoeba histolytica TaxID=5759 RepID=M3S7K5_ENTH1|nr:auxin efflux carrier family protein [Entamoeba histolytica KU27]EMH74929.1 transporter, auxin efflux carrier family protein [Entamoeba histolytica HM-1:IMSS-B]EMS14005.1 auxin efflux carrier family protein [Entamoeba histolytica HM-3:IMSS]ENY64546.1 auxin efflux carrier family protein, putative [Entamoeba histolytica HM-1:IMSS-A]